MITVIRQVQRKERQRARRIVLVGYTNAGKTSLMNALTQAGLSARNRPFETLDTTSRALSRHGGDIVLSDTVGVIRRLPERLLGSFESTLSELREASLLVLVVDLADPERVLHARTTEDLLVRLGADQLPRVYVLNKLDRLACAPPAEWVQAVAGPHPHRVLSTRDHNAVQELRQYLISSVRRSEHRATVFVRDGDAETMAQAYASCRVLHSALARNGVRLIVEGQAHRVQQLRARSQRSGS